MKVAMGLNNGLHNVPVRIKPGQSSLAPPPLIIIIIIIVLAILHDTEVQFSNAGYFRQLFRESLTHIFDMLNIGQS